MCPLKVSLCIRAVCAFTIWSGLSPGFAASFHVIRQRDVVGPHVKLPLPQAKNSTVHTTAVDADPHVYIDPCDLSYQPETRTNAICKSCHSTICVMWIIFNKKFTLFLFAEYKNYIGHIEFFYMHFICYIFVYVYNIFMFL